MKPRQGDEVTYTDRGADFYQRLRGKKPPDNVLGIVESFSSEGRVCIVKNRNGDTDSFIWIFSDGLNSHFDWPGKEKQQGE